MTKLRNFALLTLGLFAVAPAFAEKADANKPVQLEADKITVDDGKKVYVLEGNVVLNKGTMQLKTERLVVTTDANGFQKSVATGGANGLAYFRERKDNSDEYVEGHGERIVHDDRSQITDLFDRAWLKNGKNEVNGAYIRYDATTENYTVTNTGTTPANNTGRVRAIIQPRQDEPVAPIAPSQTPRSSITLPAPTDKAGKSK
ncbi:MAG TPA: lipopolysaccharide transport periplasmic protein LptA [Rhodocyclaceae bacterium]|jgi:lipopolysaccharide export system protein LptA|nr:lipopolysaccharide transport periplasmic protein LptA [Rhodocyclaceae bacterium]